MDFYGKKTVWSFIDEQPRTLQTPSQLSLRPAPHQPLPESDIPLSPARLSSASPFAPSSPESPWALSPLCASPSPSLLYHCIASLHRLDGGIYSIAISKGMVFTGSASRRVRVWRQPECLERGHLKTSSGNIGAILAFNNMLFTAHKDHKIRVWSVSLSERLTSKKLATLPRRTTLLPFMRTQPQHQQHKDTISCLAYYHAEGLLYSASWDKTVKTWRVADKRCVDSFVAHDERINSIVVNQDDGFVFTGSSDGSIKIWRRMCGDISHTLTMTLKFQPSPVNALALSTFRGSCFLYSGSSDGLVNFWEKESIFGRYHHGGFLQGHRFGVLCLTAIDKLIFSGSEDTTIRVWSREDGSSFHVCLAVIEGHRGPVKCLAACVEIEKVFMGFLVYSASLDRTVKVWRIKVLAGSEKATAEDTEDEDVHKNMMVDHEMSPVLSPSWMEKKLQGIH
ncbi:protein JINGUBANG-like [Aristolochia californica]|uniref:protein JINGUBANG-like n=1 Tax=Aristolochia californica TaxID=171875 RepID=UPI0035D78204